MKLFQKHILNYKVKTKMNCAKSAIKILFSNLIFNKEYRNLMLISCLKSYFSLAFYKELVNSKDTLAVTIIVISITLYGLFVGASKIVIIGLVMCVVGLFGIYSIYVLYKNLIPVCTPACKAIGRTDFKKGIGLIIRCELDPEYEPTEPHDIEILELLNKEIN